MRTKLLSSFLLVCTLLSCDSDQEITPAPEPIKTFNFSFRYDTALEGAKDFELILSDKDGKVLLDTLIAFNTNHSLRIKSQDTKHDVTTILKYPTENSYWMQTFLQVNPDKWHLNRTGSSNALIESEGAEITYTNIPYDRNFHFSTRRSSGYSGSWSGNAFILKNLNRLHPTDLAYIMLPNYGKYLFTELASNQTTADFSEAGNTEKRKFNWPANSTNHAVFLDGFTKAGDFSSRLSLYSPLITPSLEYDLQFPPTGIEEYNLDVRYTDAGGYYHVYQHKGENLPTEINFAPKSDFSVSKSGYDDFEVTFTDDKPSMYRTYWSVYDTSLDIRWNIYSSPDESTYKPKAFLEGLKSKKLTGVDLSLLKLKDVTTSKFRDYTYQEYLDVKASPTLFLYNEVRQSRIIQKAF